MNRFALSLALPLLAAACAPERTAPTDVGGVASLADTTCAAGTASTQLHADFPDGTSLDLDDCFGVRSMPGPAGHGDFWNNHYLDFGLKAPDGATSLYLHSYIPDAMQHQAGDDLTFPGGQDWMRLTLTTAHGSPEGGPGTLHLDEWKLPSSMDAADGLFSATITTTLKAVDGSETKVRLKVTGVILDSFLI